MKVGKLIGLAVLALACSPLLASEEDLGYQGTGSTDSETVGEALSRMKGDPNYEVQIHEGWTIVASKPHGTMWSFTPPSHPAHPAYVRREVVEENGTISIATSAKCGASKAACDALVRQFLELNNQVSERIQKQ